jgi:hypothetical protein
MASSKTARKKTVRKKAARTPAAPLVAKIDFRKSDPDLYKARRTVTELRPPTGVFLAVDGTGEPGGAAFQDAVQQLYALAYTTKFAMKKAGGADFGIPPLECLWPDDPSAKPKSQWRWRLMLRVPPCVKAGPLQRVRKMIEEKQGLATDAVKRMTWNEGRALQVLHVGPYDSVHASYVRLMEAAAPRGLVCVPPGHEVYLSDPRRVPPDRLKTIVRMAVRKA